MTEPLAVMFTWVLLESSPGQCSGVSKKIRTWLLGAMTRLPLTKSPQTQ